MPQFLAEVSSYWPEQNDSRTKVRVSLKGSWQVLVAPHLISTKKGTGAQVLHQSEDVFHLGGATAVNLEKQASVQEREGEVRLENTKRTLKHYQLCNTAPPESRMKFKDLKNGCKEKHLPAQKSQTKKKSILNLNPSFLPLDLGPAN